MSTFKRIFLTLTLALLGAMALPAMAAECQMQPDGNMVCDGQVFAPVPAPTPSVAKDSAHPSTQDSTANTTSQNPASNFSQEEKVAMEELAEIEKNEAQSYFMMGIGSFVLIALVLFGIFLSSRSNSDFARYFRVACGVFLMLIVTPLSVVYWTKFMMYHMSSSTEQQIENMSHQIEARRVEQLRAIRDNAIRREANRR